MSRDLSEGARQGTALLYMEMRGSQAVGMGRNWGAAGEEVRDKAEEAGMES